LACRPGELVTRGEIEKALWGDDEFVEFEHAVNTAIRKVREALGDDVERPRFIETLPRKGYRFIAAVETSAATESHNRNATETVQGLRKNGPSGNNGVTATAAPPEEASEIATSYPAGSKIATPAAADTDFSLPRAVARWLFLAVQFGYLAMYGVALYRAEAIEEVLASAPAGLAAIVGPLVLIVALCGIAVRLYLLSSVGLHHPAAGAKFRRLFPALFILDILWAMSPLLLLQAIGYGLALGAMAPLAYLPFSQRTLVRSIYRD
jgi:hypothetical protein